MLTSDKLQTFAIFAEDPNLSRTARRLHLSQPAVHAQLKALAEELGVPLYRRAGRGLVLTREGSDVAAFARESVERARELAAQLRGESAESPIILAAGSGALVHLLAGGLRAFKRARTRTLVEVITASADQAVELVRTGLAHIGVGVLAAPPPLLEHQVLARATQVLVVPRGHRLAAKRSIALRDLAGEPLVMPPEGGPQRSALDAAFAAKEVPVHVSASVRGWDVILKLVELGVGLGIVNAICTIPRGLVARPIRELPSSTYLAFTRPRPRAEVVAFMRGLVAAAAERGVR